MTEDNGGWIYYWYAISGQSLMDESRNNCLNGEKDVLLKFVNYSFSLMNDNYKSLT